jgi:hypothetical protein
LPSRSLATATVSRSYYEKGSAFGDRRSERETSVFADISVSDAFIGTYYMQKPSHRAVEASGGRDLSQLHGSGWISETGGGAMQDHPEKGGVLEVTCPCCDTRITVDPASGVVLGSEKASHPRTGFDLKDAQRVVEQETARIHERYDQIVQTEKGRGAALEKLFKSHMEKAKDEPVSRPLLDIDLD